MKTKRVLFEKMIMIDNVNGFGGALVQSEGTDGDYEESLVELNDNKIYGESEASDCPPDGSFCKPFDKFGIVMTQATYGGKDLLITSISGLPMIHIVSLSVWGIRFV